MANRILLEFDAFRAINTALEISSSRDTLVDTVCSATACSGRYSKSTSERLEYDERGGNKGCYRNNTLAALMRHENTKRLPAINLSHSSMGRSSLFLLA